MRHKMIDFCAGTLMATAALVPLTATAADTGAYPPSDAKYLDYPAYTGGEQELTLTPDGAARFRL